MSIWFLYGTSLLVYVDVLCSCTCVFAVYCVFCVISVVCAGVIATLHACTIEQERTQTDAQTHTHTHVDAGALLLFLTVIGDKICEH